MTNTKTTTTTTRQAKAYLRCSTTEQGDSGLGLAAQRATIEAWAARENVEVVEWVEEVQSGKSMAKRPALRNLVAGMQAGEVLVSASVSRLARSVSDLAGMLDTATKRGYGVAAIDTGLDSATPAGRMVFQMLGAAAEYERALVGQRTKDALAAAKRRGTTLGRPVIMVPNTKDELRRLRATGLSLAGVATALNQAGHVTPTGKAWTRNNVARVLQRTGGDLVVA
jgi:DNA invertase Pin-like site-specific DNA recombinase